MSEKAWWVQPYGEEWGMIVHADTRSEARGKGLGLIEEWTWIRAVRLPTLDGKLITLDRLLEAGFPKEWEGEPITVSNYLIECNCELCKASMAAHRPQTITVKQ